MKVNIRLTSLTEMLAKGHHQADIAKELGISKVAVHKHIKRLLDSGLIVESPESTYHLKFYHVNQILTMSEKGLTSGRYTMVYDPHNYALKFKLAPNGQGTFPKDRKVTKRNWDAFYAQSNNVDLELTTKHLLATLGDRIRFQIRDSKDVEIVTMMVHSILIQAAKDAVEKYGMIADLNHPIPSRKELGITDPLIKADGIAYRTDTHKKVYPNDDKLEFRKEQDLKNFVDNRIVDNKIDRVLDVVTDFSKNIALHLDVLRAQSDTLKDIREAIKTPRIDDLGPKTNESLIHTETLDIIESFVAEDRGILREYPALNAHAKIWLPKAVADLLVKQGKAKLC